MNKAYRIVWNKSRNCLMVVGENIKSAGKSPSTKKAVANAVSAALMALAGQAAFAAGDKSITSAETTTQSPDAGYGLTVESSGSVIIPSSPPGGIAVSVTGGSATFIRNLGTISADSGYGIYSASTLTGGIQNSGYIGGAIGVGLDQGSSVSGGLNNSGSIKSTDIDNSNGGAWVLQLIQIHILRVVSQTRA